ncbi:MAG: sensor histidine kinase, partial [Lachnospiraceae bacterium]
MDKIKRKPTGKPLRGSIVFYITVFTLAALLLSGMTANLCKLEAQNIRGRYPTSGHKYYLTDENGNRLGGGEYIGTMTEPLSEQDAFWLSALEVLPVLATPVWSALCIFAAAVLFYRNKLEKPLLQLRAASEKISENDLNFRVELDLCQYFGQKKLKDYAVFSSSSSS